MAKRSSLTDMAARVSRGRKVADEAGEAKPGVEMVISAIHVPLPTLELLRMVAVKRASAKKGRPSVSALLVELVERHRTELEAEAGLKR